MPENKTKDKEIAVRGRIMVSRHYGGEEAMEFEDLEVQKFSVEPAFVQAKYGLTINLGNYESARIDAAVTLPTYVEEVEAAHNTAFELAENKIKELSAEVKAHRDGR